MADVILRFYGRFVYAEPLSGGRSKGRFDVLAPNFDSARFGAHHAVMSVRRDCVVTEDATQTNLAPSLRVLSDAQIQQAETFVWDLAGRNVTFRVAGGAKLAPDTGVEIPNLQKLEALRNRPQAAFDVTSLQAGKGGRAQSVISVEAGLGRASMAFPAECSFVTEADALDGDDTNDIEMGGPIQPADLVEFVITLPPGKDRLAIELTDPYGAARHQVTVLAGPSAAVVSFSNLCSSIPTPKQYDEEFTQYYAFLATNPGSDALIPKDPSQGGSGGDCDKPALVQFDE